MKTIEPISIWDAGQNKEADILNAFAVNVTLDTSATFYYTLSNEQEQLAQGNLTMSGEAYAEWSNNDDYAWEWIAGQLNLTIIGDYVPTEPISEVAAQTEPEFEPIIPTDNNLE